MVCSFGLDFFNIELWVRLMIDEVVEKRNVVVYGCEILVFVGERYWVDILCKKV